MDSTLAPSDGIEMASVTTDTRCDESTSAQAPTGCDTVPVTIEYDGQDDKLTFSMKRLMKFAGPGLLMSIAYVDPGNLESDLQTGARTGYTLGWLVFWSTFLGFLVQLLAMRLGIVTNKHLAQHCRDVYPVAPRIFLWLMTEVAIIGSDIQEVIGSAIAIQLLSNSAVPLWAGVLITGVDTFFLLFLEKLGARKLEAFFGVLVATMTASFGVMYVKAKCPTADVLLGVLLPKMRSSDLDIAMGVVGALVMPHNIFLHSALVQSRKIDMSSKVAKREAILYNAIESGASLGITVVINLFVVAVFAAGFHGTDAVKDVGLSSAGTYLGARFGEVTKIIWAIGLLAAGQSSTMTGTYTGQFVMSGFMDLQVGPPPPDRSL
jgi:natural resistance-associated macrophage protein 2